MKRHIKNLISVIFSFLKFSIIKLFHGKCFRFHLIERFSPNTELDIGKNSLLVLKEAVRAHSGSKFRVRNGAKLTIGKNTTFGYKCMITCRHEISIGEGTDFGPNVLIYDHDHDFKATGGLTAGKYKYGSVQIGNEVWVGANVIILKGTKIGNNCVIAAGSIISGTFPDNTIIIQKRETEVIKYRKE
ncbi:MULTISPECIES: acyltransferase [Psychrilyobacter]|uniref:Acyltransferase n=1 Tax=Psychrilyobacter piezotolerans TaxID=2293438 RepID=A0ABX9KE48_9FUSO|nr:MULTISPECIES: acyltransferase [Psychrilyobacter]MCS5422119.1 acyltransferase [Psychrilyobacter sp. S5]NDI76284.1 acyltransferase [Psychrilyobacter piezotolerans]RDE59169.1 acyltransferase [Psychrilyobacter sp. S5]REI39731.1 acyltransferase [Psychrilyobacter piezotolerans]